MVISFLGVKADMPLVEAFTVFSLIQVANSGVDSLSTLKTHFSHSRDNATKSTLWGFHVVLVTDWGIKEKLREGKKDRRILQLAGLVPFWALAPSEADQGLFKCQTRTYPLMPS